MEEDWKYRVAKKKVKKVKGFYSHFATWLVMSAFFIFLNLVTDGGEFWAIFPIMGWGVGVALHAVGVFGFPGRNADWEERMIEQEMAKLDQRSYGRRSTNELPPYRNAMPDDEDGLELKEVRKEWRDSDLV